MIGIGHSASIIRHRSFRIDHSHRSFRIDHLHRSFRIDRSCVPAYPRLERLRSLMLSLWVTSHVHCNLHSAALSCCANTPVVTEAVTNRVVARRRSARSVRLPTTRATVACSCHHRGITSSVRCNLYSLAPYCCATGLSGHRGGNLPRHGPPSLHAIGQVIHDSSGCARSCYHRGITGSVRCNLSSLAP